MLTQQEADALIEALKDIQNVESVFSFPPPGDSKTIDLVSTDKKHEFIVDVNRKGNVSISKECTYQGRYRRDIPLLRLDVGGPKHTNPDGEELPGTHLHIYRERYGDRYAIAVPEEIKDTNDLFQTLIDFLIYFKAVNADKLEIETVM